MFLNENRYLRSKKDEWLREASKASDRQVEDLKSQLKEAVNKTEVFLKILSHVKFYKLFVLRDDDEMFFPLICD
jgi:ElaB/YqjD/DUF883 family membrane-anchored ribosome-binding protein